MYASLCYSFRYILFLFVSSFFFIHVLVVQELSGRIIRVAYAKRFKKPPGVPPPPTPPQGETRHKLYVSNLAWKVRSTHLREFFSASYNPISARVVFDNASGRAAGYGFVSFDTKEQAEAALSALDGKVYLNKLHSLNSLASFSSIILLSYVAFSIVLFYFLYFRGVSFQLINFFLNKLHNFIFIIQILIEICQTLC